jgi:regulatory protein
MLARRELSEAQVRQRLARRGFEPDSIDDAVNRLKSERAIDDQRVAMAIAHSETAVKRRGKIRVQRQIEAAGIAPATARTAVNQQFGEIDEPALLEAALARRLRPGQPVSGDAEFARLYRYLLGQGFEPDAVVRLLSRRRRADVR